MKSGKTSIRRGILVMLFVIVLPACQSGRGDALRSFRDVTPSSGIHFRHTTGASGRLYAVETVGSGGAFFDYDGDGDLDLYLVDSGALPGYTGPPPLGNRLYRNMMVESGKPTFTDVTPQAGVGESGYGMGCAVGDYDNDGDLDLYVTGYCPNTLYRNDGDGSFTDVTAQAGVDDRRWSTSAAFLDHDGDGDLDLYVVNYLEYQLDNDRPCYDNGYRVYCGPASYNGSPNTLYRNNGDGTFTDATLVAGVADSAGKGLGVVCGDLDGDGDQDIYIANDETKNTLFQNDGSGVFTDIALTSGTAFNEDGETQAGMGVDAGDYDNDGDLDLFVTNYSFETNTLYQNHHPGLFIDVSFPSGLGEPSLLDLGFGTGFFDDDNDGDLDLFVANGHVLHNITRVNPVLKYAQRNRLYDNRGDGTFTDVSSQLGPSFTVENVGRGTIFGDYDNDGDVDLLVTVNGGAPRLLRNESEHRGHWLAIRTVGTKSNSDGIGALVRVVAKGKAQIREVRSAYSYLSANDLRVHFGLKDHPKADLVEIRWPSGVVQTFHDVPADRFITVTEGDMSYRLQVTGYRLPFHSPT
jgi:hypothetical protein